MDRNLELDRVMADMIDEYVNRNSAATVLKQLLDDVGIGFAPVIDHVTLRTNGIDRRAEQFVGLGYAYDETLQFDDWYAKVYRKTGYPALFIDQAYPDERGKTSIIPGWVERFGDRAFHHIAVRVADIEQAINRLQSHGVVFTGK